MPGSGSTHGSQRAGECGSAARTRRTRWPARFFNLEVLNFHWFYGVRQLKAKDARVEVQFGLEGALNVLCTAEAVPLAFKGKICYRHTFCTQRLNHQLCLIGQDDLVIESLEED